MPARRRYSLSDRFKFGFGGFRFRRVRTAASPGALVPFLAIVQPIYSISSGSVADVILSATSVGGLVYTNTLGAVNVRGFVGGAIPGQLFGFFNAGAFNVTLKHMDGTLPDLSARMYCPGAANLVRTPNQVAVLWWNDALGYWVVVSAP